MDLEVAQAAVQTRYSNRCLESRRGYRLATRVSASEPARGGRRRHDKFIHRSPLGAASRLHGSCEAVETPPTVRSLGIMPAAVHEYSSEPDPALR